MEIERIIDNIVFFGGKPQEAIKWEELRKKILKTIDEERERGATIITSPSNVDSMVCHVHELMEYRHNTGEMRGPRPYVYEVAGSTHYAPRLEVYAGTADSDGYVYGEEDVVKVAVG